MQFISIVFISLEFNEILFFNSILFIWERREVGPSANPLYLREYEYLFNSQHALLSAAKSILNKGAPFIIQLQNRCPNFSCCI